jgi:hypothetical protein
MMPPSIVKQQILDLGLCPCVPGRHGSRGRLGCYSHTLGLADGRSAIFPANGGQRNYQKKADGNGFQQTRRALLHV